MSRCGSCPIYGRTEYGVNCPGDYGVEEYADKLQELYYAMSCEIKKLKISPPPNDPLTTEQLREMDGEIAWCKDCSRYGVISVDTKGDFEGIPFFSFQYEGINFCWNIDSRNLTLYRRRPEGGTA